MPHIRRVQLAQAVVQLILSIICILAALRFIPITEEGIAALLGTGAAATGAKNIMDAKNGH